jgi:hypothetical protein
MTDNGYVIASHRLGGHRSQPTVLHVVSTLRDFTPVCVSNAFGSSFGSQIIEAHPLVCRSWKAFLESQVRYGMIHLIAMHDLDGRDAKTTIRILDRFFEAQLTTRAFPLVMYVASARLRSAERYVPAAQPHIQRVSSLFVLVFHQAPSSNGTLPPGSTFVWLA